MVSEKKFLNQLNRPQAAAFSCPHHRFCTSTADEGKEPVHAMSNLCAESKSSWGAATTFPSPHLRHQNARAGSTVQSTGRRFSFPRMHPHHRTPVDAPISRPTHPSLVFIGSKHYRGKNEVGHTIFFPIQPKQLSSPYPVVQVRRNYTLRGLHGLCAA